VSAQPLPMLLIGDSLPMRRLRSLIARVAGSALPVLIQGETGSGKELVARTLHQHSGRNGALVSLNVCALAEATSAGRSPAPSETRPAT
jgi:DNA-binding NtrC family response regulator